MSSRSVASRLLSACLFAACNRSPVASRASADGGSLASPAVAPAPSTLGASVAWHGPRLFVSNEASGDVSVLAVPTNDVIATVPVGKRPRGIQRSPDGTRVYVTLSGSVAAGPNVKGPVPPPDRSADGIGVLDTALGTLTDRL